MACRRGGIAASDIGAITVGPTHSVVEIAKNVAEDFARATEGRDPRDPRVLIKPEISHAHAPAPPRPRPSRPALRASHPRAHAAHPAEKAEKIGHRAESERRGHAPSPKHGGHHAPKRRAPAR
jgi:hypothetical protein